ncbi:MAG: VWA domain-containing protein [Candidatus Aenigmarchaeota archaeon]|nr:VWA domain-containing protein [Candidatus Aenigmarchaeota archaeon]
MGEDPTQSLLREDQKSGGENPQVTQMLYENHKNDPGGFAGVFGALDGTKPDDALRLMYRARARELLMRMIQEDDEVGERTPSYRTAWNIGEPLTGKGALDIQQSLMSFPRLVPGLNTVKRTYQMQEGYETIKRTPDLFLEIDSSSSMSWNPWAADPEQRGKFDKAILAAEGATLYALANGARVAVINYSGIDEDTKTQQMRLQEYTRNLDDVERALMYCYSGGTFIPARETVGMIKSTNNPLITALMSDCDLSNPGDARAALLEGVTKHDKVVIFKLPGEPAGENFAKGMQGNGAIVYKVNNIQDLDGIVVGAVKAEYDARRAEKVAYNIIGLRQM